MASPPAGPSRRKTSEGARSGPQEGGTGRPASGRILPYGIHRGACASPTLDPSLTSGLPPPSQPPPSRGRVPSRDCDPIRAPESGADTSLMGEAGRGWGHPRRPRNRTNHLHLVSILSPSPKPVAHSSPSPRMGGLQANSGGVIRARALPLAQVRVPAAAWRAFMLRDNRNCSKNRRPEAAIVSFLNFQRRQSSRGPLVQS